MDNMINKIEGGTEMRAILAFLYVSGARISEVLILRVRDVIVDGSDVKVTVATLKRGKSGSPITLTRDLVFTTTTPYINLFIDHWLYAKKEMEENPDLYDKDLYLFDSNRKQVWYYIHKVNDYCSPHIFRHSRLQKLADLGASAHEIRLWAGHKRVETSTRYIEQSAQMSERWKYKID